MTDGGVAMMWLLGLSVADGGKLAMKARGGTEIGCAPARPAQDEWRAKVLLDEFET